MSGERYVLVKLVDPMRRFDAELPPVDEFVREALTGYGPGVTVAVVDDIVAETRHTGHQAARMIERLS